MKRSVELLTVGFLLLIGASVLISSCQKEDPNVAPGKATLTLPLNSATDVALNSTLSWQAAIDPDGDAIIYDVYFGTDATPVTVASSGQKSTTYTPTLIANNTYFWKVVAKDPKDGTSESSVWNFSTLNNGPGIVALTSPDDEAANVALDATLSWQAATDPDGDAVVYDVYIGTDVIPVTLASTDQSGTTYTATLAANTTYYWKVIAKDDKGGTGESAIWSFSTLNNAPGSVSLTAPANEAGGIALSSILSWQAATDPDGDAVVYDVYFGTDASPETVISADQEGITYVPTLTPGTTYYWKVVAKDPYGGISESTVWSFTAIIQIGDFYQGGIVFYLDGTGNHGLICPITNQSPPSPEVHGGWGCANGVNIDGADATAIGTGLQNTLDIIAACPTIGIAAEICASLTLNGYEDWYLPSIDELKAMHQQRNIITEYALANGGEDFIGHYYYSSSESTGAYAFAIYWPNGNTNQVGKANFNYPFRAVRAF